MDIETPTKVLQLAIIECTQYLQEHNNQNKPITPFSYQDLLLIKNLFRDHNISETINEGNYDLTIYDPLTKSYCLFATVYGNKHIFLKISYGDFIYSQYPCMTFDAIVTVRNEEISLHKKLFNEQVTIVQFMEKCKIEFYSVEYINVLDDRILCYFVFNEEIKLFIMEDKYIVQFFHQISVYFEFKNMNENDMINMISEIENSNFREITRLLTLTTDFKFDFKKTGKHITIEPKIASLKLNTLKITIEYDKLFEDIILIFELEIHELVSKYLHNKNVKLLNVLNPDYATKLIACSSIGVDKIELFDFESCKFDLVDNKTIFGILTNSNEVISVKKDGNLYCYECTTHKEDNTAIIKFPSENNINQVTKYLFPQIGMSYDWFKEQKWEFSYVEYQNYEKLNSYTFCARYVAKKVDGVIIYKKNCLNHIASFKDYASATKMKDYYERSENSTVLYGRKESSLIIDLYEFESYNGKDIRDFIGLGNLVLLNKENNEPIEYHDRADEYTMSVEVTQRGNGNGKDNPKKIVVQQKSKPLPSPTKRKDTHIFSEDQHLESSTRIDSTNKLQIKSTRPSDIANAKLGFKLVQSDGILCVAILGIPPESSVACDSNDKHRTNKVLTLSIHSLIKIEDEYFVTSHSSKNFCINCFNTADTQLTPCGHKLCKQCTPKDNICLICSNPITKLTLLDKNELLSAITCVHKTSLLKYIVGEILIDDKFNKSLDQVCVPGIHYNSQASKVITWLDVELPLFKTNPTKYLINLNDLNKWAAEKYLDITDEKPIMIPKKSLS